MLIWFILNLLNLIIFLNIFSFYSNFALNIEVLLLFIFISIILNLFLYLYLILVNFINVKKDEVLKEYFLSLFDLFNLLIIFKEKLFFFRKILIKLYNYIKYIYIYVRLNFVYKFLKIKNFYLYIFNNVLNNYFLYSLFIKNKIFNYYFNFKKKIFFFSSYYGNILIKEEDSSLPLDVLSFSLILLLLKKNEFWVFSYLCFYFF